MSIELPCPKCGRVYKVSDDAIGKKARCKACQSLFVLTQPLAGTANSPTPPDPRYAPVAPKFARLDAHERHLYTFKIQLHEKGWDGWKATAKVCILHVTDKRILIEAYVSGDGEGLAIKGLGIGLRALAKATGQGLIASALDDEEFGKFETAQEAIQIFHTEIATVGLLEQGSAAKLMGKLIENRVVKVDFKTQGPLVFWASPGKSGLFSARVISKEFVEVMGQFLEVEDPSDQTVPAGLVLRRAKDVKQLLPERMPRFHRGDKPVPGTDLVIEELLGVGGFGEVWKASHQSRPDLPPVALKFYIDKTAARTLLQEIEVLDRVSRLGRHCGIVELRYIYMASNTPCLEYEYVDGGDLAGLVVDLHRAGKATPRTMTRLFSSLVQAVSFVHRNQPPIVHRDLKPTNVLTTRGEKGVVLKVSDFGIGGIVAELDKRLVAETVGEGSQATSAGSCPPLYASPQQRRGAGPDPRDDVYALGIIWYQMLVGDVTKEPPRGGSWKKRLLEQGTTPGMLALLERCLEDDPAGRPADAQVLFQELQAVVAPPRESSPGK